MKGVKRFRLLPCRDSRSCSAPLVPSRLGLRPAAFFPACISPPSIFSSSLLSPRKYIYIHHLRFPLSPHSVQDITFLCDVLYSLLNPNPTLPPLLYLFLLAVFFDRMTYLRALMR